MSERRLPPWTVLGPAFLILSAVTYPTFVPDDLYIYLQFVRNLLDGAGPSFNPGHPTYGFTSALWLGVLTAAGGVSRHLEAAARVASAATAVAALAGIGTLARRLSGSRVAGWVAAALLALDAWFLRWATTGMESMAAVALLTGGFARREREDAAGLSPVGSTALFALLALVRPEAFLLLALSLADAALPRSDTGGSWRPRRAARALTTAVVLVGPWMLYAAVRFGTAVPDTAPAKGVPGAAVVRIAESLIRIAGLGGITVGIPVLLLAFAAVTAGGPARRAALARHRLLAAWLVSLPLLYALTGVKVYSRYLLLVTPLWLAAGLAAGRWAAAGRWRGAWWAAAAAAALGNLVLTFGWVAPASRAYGRSFRAVNVALGEWLATHTATDALVAAENIGAIAFHSRRRILDMNGLISPEVIPFKRAGRVDAYLEKHPPDYVIKIDPRPDPWSSGGPALDLEVLRILPYEHMFIDQKAPLYYTLYRVRDGTDGKPVVR
ncbi:MAG: hypothetical protein PVF68_00645 [Acidobacteriota bacterium]|jgi:hypothetical protein